MNTELLREDEICSDWSQIGLLHHAHRLEKRLIEEREKNAELNRELNSLSDALADLEAELAKVREMLRDMTSPNCQCDECCRVRDYFAATTNSVPK